MCGSGEYVLLVQHKLMPGVEELAVECGMRVLVSCKKGSKK